MEQANRKLPPEPEKKERSQGREIWRRLRKNKGAMLGLVIVVSLVLTTIFSSFYFDYDTQVIKQNTLQRLKSPSAAHFFGTDELGRDLFVRVLYGSRYSLVIGVVSVSIALVLGVFLGAIAGYFGGAVEEVIMRGTDIFQSVPITIMAIVIVVSLGQNILNLMIAIGLTSVPGFVRITRASVLTVKNQEFVEASRAIGLSRANIIFNHILPNCLAPIIVQTTLRVATAIVTASTLSFLGLGVPAPRPEWGGLLATGRAHIRDYSYMTFFPGLAIMITVLALNLLGDGLRDALDPRLKK